MESGFEVRSLDLESRLRVWTWSLDLESGLKSADLETGVLSWSLSGLGVLSLYVILSPESALGVQNPDLESRIWTLSL